MTRHHSHAHPFAVPHALAALTTLALASPALAQPAPDEVPAEEPAAAPRYPRAVIARPLTLPAIVAAIGADAVSNNDVSELSGAPVVGFGITDKLEVQVPYAFGAREFEARGSLGVDAGYAFIRGALDGKLETVARIRGGFHVLEEHPTPLMIGVHAQYNITPWLAVISGVPGSQQLRISLAEDEDTMKPIDFGLPIGVGVQVIDTVYLQLDTKLATIGISDAAHSVIGRDSTPLSLTAVWNIVQAFDVQALVGTDLNDASEALTFLLGARFYAGEL